MVLPPRLPAYAWPIALLGALAFLAWVNHERMTRVEFVTSVAEWSVDPPVVDPRSPTGYAGGLRRLIVPEHNNESYQWIAQTQQMLSGGEWRVRHVDYENAPHGREVLSSSPLRWWLGLLAWGDAAWSGRPLGVSVERASLVATPLLHGLMLLATTVLVARCLGLLPAAAVAIALVSLFPFAGGFLPGVPDHRGLALGCALWSLLLLVPGLRAALAPAPAERAKARRWFAAAGIAGAAGLWIDAATQLPILAGIAAGAAVGEAVRRSRPGEPAAPPLPWRAWAMAGAAASVVAYLIEFFPAHMGWRIEVNHPAYAIAWLGAAELVVRTTAHLGRGSPAWNQRDALALLVALAALAAPVAVGFAGGGRIFSEDPFATRLSPLQPVVAENFIAWVARDGFSPAVLATCLPLLAVAPAVVLLWQRRTPAADRVFLAVTLGAVGVALGLALVHLRQWNTTDAALLAAIAATATAAEGRWSAPRPRLLLAGAMVLAVLPGAILLLPSRPTNRREVTEADFVSLVERDLAHWLARRSAPDAVVLGSPDLTTTLCFHGGLRGLGTLNWESQDGLAAAVRIASASTEAEALTLIAGRDVDYIVLPSWDAFLEQYARLGRKTGSGSDLPATSLIAALYRWELPPWLHPVPYRVPELPGLEKQHVVVFAVTDNDDPAVAASRLVDYFLEMGAPRTAATSLAALRRYPGDAGALAGVVQIQSALGDRNAHAAALQTLVAHLSTHADPDLPWDRRVSLAGVLAHGRHFDLALAQARRCLREADDARLRSLTSGSLLRFLLFCQRFDLEFPERGMRDRAVALLPPDMRSQLLPEP